MRCRASSVDDLALELDGIQNVSRDGYLIAPKEVPDTEDGDFKLHYSARVPRSLTFWHWCFGLTKMVLRSRTPFAAFLCTTLHLQRGDNTTTSPLFPVPVPCPGIFDRMPSGLSLRARRRIHLRRVVHVMVMAQLLAWRFGNFSQREAFDEAAHEGSLQDLPEVERAASERRLCFWNL